MVKISFKGHFFRKISAAGYHPGSAFVTFTFLLIFFIPSILFSQDKSIIFSHINVNDGLSENWIKCIYKDAKGFLWFGTNSGLNRFDGYNFEIFRKNDSDSASVADNSINIITGDNEGNLWVGTGSGISVLNPDTYKFKKIDLVPYAPPQCNDIGYITAMAADHKGNILVGTHNGLFLVSNKNNFTRHLLIDEQSCSSQLNNITAITPDKANSFWIGTANGFLIRYNQGSNTLERFKSFEEGNTFSGSIARLFVDNDNYLWVADQRGLHLFDTNKKKWDTDFQKNSGEIFRNLVITGIDQDTDNQIWVITDGKGAFIIDADRSGIFNVLNIPYAEGSLSSNGLYSLCCDKSGIVWLGSSKKGVDFYKKNVRKFRTFRNLPADATV